MNESSKDLTTVNDFLSKMESTMKQDSKNRKKILKSVEKELDAHSKKLIEYDQIEKAYKLLEVKYNVLKKEFDDNINNSSNTIDKLKTTVESLDSENKILKKMIMNQKRKVSGLQSIVELMVKDYGISNIEVVTGLSAEKIKEYFQD